MIWFLIFIFSCYAILIISLSIGFRKVKPFSSEKTIPKTTFSVVIPFRNEAEKLPFLLKSIEELNYPKSLFEIIFVDDASEDNSVSVIQKLFSVISNKKRGEISNKEILPNVRLTIKIINNIRTSNSPKKNAITSAISIAKNNWIVTTDADCLLPKNWLQTLDNFIQKSNTKMIVAPVNYTIKNSFLHRFQLLDFMSMQGTTIGGFGINFPFMCNGANLTYKKEDFIKLNGFEGNNNIASGDDVFLLEKFIKNDVNSVRFLKSQDAVVNTFPVNSWNDLVNQRVRWASKTGNFKSIKVKLIGLLILIINMSILFSFFGCLIKQSSYTLFLILFASKSVIDLFLFLPTIKFFEQEKSFWESYLLSSFLYPFFSVWVIFKSVFFKYNWKGREFKK